MVEYTVLNDLSWSGRKKSQEERFFSPFDRFIQKFNHFLLGIIYIPQLGEKSPKKTLLHSTLKWTSEKKGEGTCHKIIFLWVLTALTLFLYTVYFANYKRFLTKDETKDYRDKSTAFYSFILLTLIFCQAFFAKSFRTPVKD